MIYKFLEILTLGGQLQEINDKFNAWTDKLTSNGIGASAITVIFFAIICLSVIGFSKK